MKITIHNSTISLELIQVPDLNFGQFQRWESHKKLRYELEIDLSEFIDSIEVYFNDFRKTEIEDDDVMEFTELISYKNLGFPTLTEMLTNHQELLSDLLIFNAYDILHLLFNLELPSNNKQFYSINSLDTIRFTKSRVLIIGICFLVKLQ